LDFAVRRQRHLARPRGGEHLKAALQLDQLAKHREAHECAPGRVWGGAKRFRPQPAMEPVGFIRVKLVGVGGHLLPQFFGESLAMRLEHRQMGRR
jgi:hypothetical protein